MAPRRLDYIDALRGIAVTGVIVSHVKTQFPDMHWRILKVMELGAHGVQLFFVASALTLMLSWNARQDGAAPFYLRRLFRIAPMFWLATALYGSLNAAGLWPDGGSDLTGIVTTLLFIHGWTPETINLVVPGGWTIGVEMTFYAAFPLIATTITTLPRAILFLAAACGLAAIANSAAQHLMTATPPQALAFFVYYWFPNALPVFACGCLAYHLRRWAPVDRGAAVPLLGITVLLLLYCAWWPLPWFPTLGGLMSRSLLTGFVSVVLALSLAGPRMPWLVNRGTCFVGKVSFSAYLLHFLIVLPLTDYLGPIHASRTMSVVLFAASLTAVMGVTVWLSSLTYRFIERPCIQAGNRLIRGVVPMAG
jgi:peptidoglycan/LPS O-acetylase OafA/YrhL